MLISYIVKLTITNNITGDSVIFNKDFESTITVNNDALYDNYHVLHSSVYVLDLFPQEISDYCNSANITTDNITIEEYEIATITDNVEVFFENPVDINTFTLTPEIKCYVYPQEPPLPVPNLLATVYDSTTIVWSWSEEDKQYAHYLIEVPAEDAEDINTRIIATIPINAEHYIETGLEPNTAYTRQLINFTNTQTSLPSEQLTMTTETVDPKVSVTNYNVEREHDWTITDEEREIIKENLAAFKSGIGDFDDLKVYKQMDKDFYEKFKAYFTLTGEYTQREKRYNQVGFNYKICLEAKETITEQEGEVTFKLDAYPWQEMYRSEYLWTVKPVTVYAKVCAYVDLFKEVPAESPVIKKTINWTEEIVTEPVDIPTTIILSIDLSSSMRIPRDDNNKPTLGRLNKTKKAAIALLDELEKTGHKDLNFIITGYADVAHSVKCANINDAKNVIENLQCGVLEPKNVNFYELSGFTKKETVNNVDPLAGRNVDITIDGVKIGNGHGIISGNAIGNCTNWGDGFTDCLKEIDANRNVNMIFFTDGYPNAPYFYDKHYDGDAPDKPTKYQSMYADIEASIRECLSKVKNIYTVFGKQAEGFVDDGTKYDDDYIKTCQEKITKHPLAMSIENIANKDPDKRIFYQVINNDNLEDDNDIDEQNLINAFKNSTQIILEGTTETIQKTGDIEITVPYTSVEHKTVYIESEPIPFTINSINTPVAYSDRTHRAEVIGRLNSIQMSDKSILELLTTAKYNCNEWLYEGYNYNISATDDNGNPIGDVFKNIHIKDTYTYGAEDSINNTSFNTFGYGMTGTINVFSDIPKISTTTNVDDEYVATDNSFLYISGYTNAIIYDCIRSAHIALNAYKNPQETVFAKRDLGPSLKNRANSNISYGANINPKNVFSKELVLKLPDPNHIQITGDGINQDMVARLDLSFSSPMLNYRFNIKDPEAYTPYYEILPDVDKNSSDKYLIRLSIYYAKNVEINSDGLNDNYYDLFDYTNPAKSPLIFEYGLNNKWNSAQGIFDNDGQWITQYLHFYARKMTKIQDYYDEYPNENMDSMYGLVNGRYRSDNLSGKQDLFVDTPEFNIPSTVLAEHSDTIKIYIKITEKYPDDALVSYKWDHETSPGSGYTQINGDYVTFSSESLTYKDIKYTKTLATIETEEIELFSQDPLEKMQTIIKPDSANYDKYFIDVVTDNGDVLATRYPTVIEFDNNNSCVVPVTYRGVINATSKWSPRIHNGYYYINQHEKFLYSEFDVKANFEEAHETEYKKATVFVNFDVEMEKPAGSTENYSIKKDTMSELLQDEEQFMWINEQGLTLKPIIEGIKYKHYQTRTWYSPVLLFDNQLTKAGAFNLDYVNTDGSNTGLNLFIRSFNLDKGEWTDWTSFTNGTIPSTVLSCGYQLKTDLSATETHSEYDTEDYLCCYLDWNEYIDENVSKNIVTITDHITTGNDYGNGTAYSKILQYGCETGLKLDMYASNKNVSLSIAYSNSINDLILENVKWEPYTSTNLNSKYKYYRFKVEIPKDEKVFWIKLNTRTLETEATLPYIKSISMTGTYTPKSTIGSFMKLETFEIPRDSMYHEIVSAISDYVTAEVIERGFTTDEITKINITSMNPDIILTYNTNNNILNSSIRAATSQATIDKVSYLPYIKTVEDKITITGTPQQYCPITVEDENGTPLRQIYSSDMTLAELHTMQIRENYIELKRNDYELETLKVWINDEEVTDYSTVNHLLMFNKYLEVNDEISVTYKIKNTFYADIDRLANTTNITVYTGEDNTKKKFKVMFETNKQNNKLVARNLSLNPVYRTNYDGFIYLTEEHNTPYKINIWCNPKRVKANGKDSVDVQIEVLDIIGNPIIGKEINIDCNIGTITCDNLETDMNGVVHCIYTSSYTKGTDTITAKMLLDNMKNLQESIKIINY